METLETIFEAVIPMALVANWDESLPVMAEKLGIARFFQDIVASRMNGTEKPNPAIFEATLAHLSLNPKKDIVLYVGNEYETDVIGARLAGLVPVLIDREGYYPHADCLHFSSLEKFTARIQLFLHENTDAWYNELKIGI